MNDATNPVDERRPGRPRDEKLHAYVRQIVAMKPGTSFFVPDAKAEELAFLRKPVKEAGATIEIYEVGNDEIYCTPGVRVFREEGECDQL